MTNLELKSKLIGGTCYTAFGVFTAAWGILTVVSTLIHLLMDGCAAVQEVLLGAVERSSELATLEAEFTKMGISPEAGRLVGRKP